MSRISPFGASPSAGVLVELVWAVEPGTGQGSLLKRAELTVKPPKPILLLPRCEGAGETPVTCGVSLPASRLYCVAIDFAEMREP